MRKLFADFETRSFCNLPQKGSYNYAVDFTTEILCCALVFDDGEPYLWTPGMGSLPDEILEHISNNNDVYFRNAAFDREIWNCIAAPDLFWPELSLQQVKCSAYVARCNNLPASLENNARALNTQFKKNPKGYELINQLSIPPYSEDPALLKEMYDYCIGDVLADRACVQLMRAPTETEWVEYRGNERINMRGVKVDCELASAAMNYAAAEEEELVNDIISLTKGEVKKARGEKLKKWVMARLTEEQIQHTVKYVKGVKKYSLDKAVRQRLLSEELDPDVFDVLEASDFAQKSSVSKFKNMLKLADTVDHRVRGAFFANGASASGRYSSRGLQLHNFTRDCAKNPEAVRHDLVSGKSIEYLNDKYGSVMQLLSSMLRPALIPEEGKVFVAADWSAIEGRVAPWLCNSRQGNIKLNVFRAGEDTYLHAANAIFHREIAAEDPERQAGKVAELACQFGGGARAIMSFGRNYGLIFSETEALNIRDGWRAANPWAKTMWRRIEGGVHAAIKMPERRIPVGRLKYFTVENVLNKPLTLFCELPCGRVLTYPDITAKVVEGKYGPQVDLSYLRAAWTPKADETEWPRGHLYGGLLFENAVQGTAASLLRSCIVDDSVDVVMHAHDELVIEVPEEEAEQAKEELIDFMNYVPEWAEGLPLATTAKIMQRYGK